MPSPFPPTSDLPIYEIAPHLLQQLTQSNRLVITAPTGSGKTTQVPQILLNSSLFQGQIIVLQPRRLATRAVAHRVAHELNSPIGQLVGYQTRHDSKVSNQTRIRFMTEGLFLRLLQSQPKLPGVSAVILDEFHERTLAADTSLALVKSLQESHRPDLKLLVMSATLDPGKVTAFLHCPHLEAAGRLFPVTHRYMEKPTRADPWDLAADALADLLTTQPDGDVLIFMPGAYEIRRTIETCRRSAPRMTFLPLHGELPAHEQDLALSPTSGGSAGRKVIVSTNVAETSITIPGVRHVIDSGLARVNRYDPRRGINVLLIEPISKASADQRAGRAGRTAPGTCTRLWTSDDQRRRPAHDLPEVQRLDLAEVVLQLKSLNVPNARTFPWLDAPIPLALDHAITLLTELDALDNHESLTPTGRTMSRFPLHPRLSRMMIEAADRRCIPRAALWAALISDRDILIRGRTVHADHAGTRSDFEVLESAYESARKANFDPSRCSTIGVHAAACRDVERAHRQILEVCEDAGLHSPRKADTDESTQNVVKCLLAAFPDHVAVRRSAGQLACAMSGGRRGVLDKASVAQHVGLILPIEIREVGAGPAKGRGAAEVKTVLSLASELEPEWLEEVHPQRVVKETATAWNAEIKAVERVERQRFGDLVFEERSRGEPQPEAAAEMLAELIVKGELKLERWDAEVDQWIARVRCVAQWFPDRKLIAYTDEELRLVVEELCAGAVRWNQVKDRDVLTAVKGVMSWDDQRFVDQMAPASMQLPASAAAASAKGKKLWKMKIEYQIGASPKGRAKIQDLYGLKESPTVAGGKVRLLLEILGPNFRPVQVTEDLAGFWKTLYPVLKKELSRKYPRHEWR